MKTTTIMILSILLLAGCTQKMDEGWGNIHCGYLVHCPDGYNVSWISGECYSCINATEEEIKPLNMTDICKDYCECGISVILADSSQDG
jgi:hypothetical protein